MCGILKIINNMILTKTTEYAVRVLTFMASKKHEQQSFSATYLHQELGIPYKYLTRLLTDLAKQDLLLSIRGRGGGFFIEKQLNEITLSQIVEAVEGMDSFNACILGFKECSSENPCALHFIWEENKKNFIKMLEETTLEDIRQQKIKRF